MPRVPESEKNGAAPGMVRRIREYAPVQPFDIHIPLSPPPGPLPIGSQKAADGADGQRKPIKPGIVSRNLPMPDQYVPPSPPGSLKKMLKA